MPAQKPETLIQSQQVTLTGTDDKIGYLLDTLHLEAKYLDVTVTITPTSVPDATVGVTQDSQQNPRQYWAVLGFYTKNIIGVCSEPADVLAEEPKSTLIPISQEEFDTYDEWHGDRAKVAVIIARDAQGSVTEQSQQKSRQDGE